MRVRLVPPKTSWSPAFALCFIAGFSGRAQQADLATTFWVHQSWSVRDGLPVNGVGSLLQDRNGYLWATTLDGLVRYDGLRFTIFNSSAAPGLPTNRFAAGVEAPDGTLWFQTEDLKLVRYRDGRFKPFGAADGVDFPIATIGRDSIGQVWVGGNHVAVIRNGRLEPVAPDTLPAAKSFIRRRDGTTWLGTFGAGIYRLDQGRAQQVIAPAAIDSGIVWSMVEDESGYLWIGTSRGLWRHGPAGTIQRIGTSRALRADVPQLIWAARQRALYASTRDGVYRFENDHLVLVDTNRSPFMPPLALDRHGSVWSGVGSQLRRDGRLIFPLPARQESVGPPVIQSILIDREGGVWLGTSRGLDRITPAIVRSISVANGLRAPNVYPIHPDDAGGVWVGTWGGGLNHVDSSGRVVALPPSLESRGNVHSIAVDRAGQLWFIGNSPLTVCESTGSRCRREPSLSEGETYALYVDRAGRMWAGLQGGVRRRDGNQWRTVDGWTGTRPVRAFLETQDSALWMGTNGDGVFRLHDGRVDHVGAGEGLPSDLIRSLYQDVRGTLWIGTEGQGLAAIDPLAWNPASGRTDRRVTRVRAQDGLYDESIHAIVADDAGRIWMNTNRGIFWVSGDELRGFIDGRITRVHSTSYSERDGLNNREGNGGYFPSAARTSNGRLWFPTQDGVVMIDPARLAAAPLAAAVIERIVAGDSTILAADVPVTLGTRQRDLQVEYTAPSFVDPANVVFRYRLEPYDEDWIDARNRRAAFYTRVPPGRYTFHVQVGSSSGTWNEAGEATVGVSLAAHFWETGWFWAALLALLALGTVSGVRWRLAHLHRRAAELELVVADRTRQLSAQNAQLERQATQLADLDRAKTRFFANVSHEFRTPLTLTIGPLEDIRSQLNGDEHTSRWLDIALRNARRLLRLVNQILDVAKLEAGQMKLVTRTFDLVRFARGVASAFEPVAEQREVTLEVTMPDALVGSFDPDAIEKILTNLLSNALKFTPRGGTVTLAAVSGDERVTITVQDTGSGIPAEHLPFVFERFYQATESNGLQEPGTGLGLSLVKELVELHGGTIDVSSEGAGAGTRFTVTLPVGDRTTSTNPAVPSIVEAGGVEDDAHSVDRDDDNPTLLIVDDSDDLRAWMREHFAARFQVYEATDGAEGITLAREHLPDIVISDVMMPRVDGFELCNVLRSSPETDFIPIVLLTAQADGDRRIEGLERGADDYLTKPFAMRELEARVDNLIASRRRLRERFTRGGAKPPAVAIEQRSSALSADDRVLLERIRAAIESSLADPEFGVVELAKAAFVDRTHLFRRTKQLVGLSPSELIRRARIERGAALLESGAGTVTDVAYAVGFNKVSHFCRVFQETYGSTPAAWRAGRSATSGA
jgi:signal transduction histidine kinase/DNA-binding response OmpR family regulator